MNHDLHAVITFGFYVTFRRNSSICEKVILDQCLCLRNCAPSPPPPQQQSTDNNVGLMLGQGRGGEGMVCSPLDSGIDPLFSKDRYIIFVRVVTS